MAVMQKTFIFKYDSESELGKYFDVMRHVHGDEYMNERVKKHLEKSWSEALKLKLDMEQFREIEKKYD
jgi:hypothetical protein